MNMQEKPIAGPSRKRANSIPIRRISSLETSLAAPLTRLLSHPDSTLVNPAIGNLRSTLPPIAHTPNASRPASPHSSVEESPYPGSGTPEDPYLVDWLDDEPANPYNWRPAFKWTTMAIIAISTLCISFASSSYSSAIPDIMKTFEGTTQEEGIAGLSLYVLGFGVGPLFWAPISEMLGRRWAFNASYPLFAIFNMAGALSTNLPMILIVRFLAGTFGSAPLTNAGGQIGDMFAAHERALATTVSDTSAPESSHERALATTLFALAPFLGPVLGPIVGGFVVEKHGFRWVFWVQFIFACVMLTLSALFVPETFAPTLLKRKAKRLQKEANDLGTGEVFISKYDKVVKPRSEIIRVGMSRPFDMMFRELIVAALGLYGALIYGILYLFFTAFPLIFQETRGWSPGIGGLAFLGIGIGLILGVALTPLQNHYYEKARAKTPAGQAVPPEARLEVCCIGAVILPLGLFVFAWTCTPNVHWVVPILASVPFGAGFLLIFTAINNYIIDSYTLYAASALAANAVQRSVLGTIFPLFSIRLYKGLGLNWAGTLIAFLALICTPLPFLFYKYGPYLRRKSNYAPSQPLQKTLTTSTEGEKDEEVTIVGGLEPGMLPTAGEDHGRTKMTV